jgi:glutathione S-transferase
VLELYYFPNATCGVKVRLALHEKNVAYTRRILDRDRGDLNTPDYRVLNPKGVVPTLVHDGHVFVESSIIMTYADDAFDGPSLRPETPLARSEMAMWLRLVDDLYFPALAALTYATSQRARIRAKYRSQEAIEKYLSHMADAEERDRRRKVLDTGAASREAQDAMVTLAGMLARMDRAMATTDYLCGDRYTLADAALTPFLSRLDLLEMSEAWTASHANVTRWWSLMKARQSFLDEPLADITDAYRDMVSTEGRKAWPILREVIGEGLTSPH